MYFGACWISRSEIPSPSSKGQSEKFLSSEYFIFTFLNGLPSILKSKWPIIIPYKNNASTFPKSDASLSLLTHVALYPALETLHSSHYL